MGILNCKKGTKSRNAPHLCFCSEAISNLGKLNHFRSAVTDHVIEIIGFEI